MVNKTRYQSSTMLDDKKAALNSIMRELLRHPPIWMTFFRYFLLSLAPQFFLVYFFFQPFCCCVYKQVLLLNKKKKTPTIYNKYLLFYRIRPHYTFLSSFLALLIFSQVLTVLTSQQSAIQELGVAPAVRFIEQTQAARYSQQRLHAGRLVDQHIQLHLAIWFVSHQNLQGQISSP